MSETNDRNYWKQRGQQFNNRSRLLTETQDFLFDVSNWKIDGYSIWSVIWINPNIDTTWWLQQTVSPQWGQYNFIETATNLYISSSENWDIANTFTLNLLDWDYNPQTIQVTPNWQTAVLIPWWTYLRINWWTNTSSTITTWDIYISTSATNTNWVPPSETIIWKIAFENYGATSSSAERLHNSVYTVPAWKTLYVYNIRAWIWKNKDAVAYLYLRPFNWVFIENIRYQLYEEVLENNLRPLVPIVEKTDLEFRATTTNNNTELTVNGSFILVDNDKI